MFNENDENESYGKIINYLKNKNQFSLSQPGCRIVVAGAP